jgi:CubicO group peptidase (beta-lactamase class C family)
MTRGTWIAPAVLVVSVALLAGPALGLNPTQVVSNTTSFLDQLDARKGFSGTVLIAKGGTPVLTRACGLANRSFDVSNKPDTKFNLGSMNKMFTSVAILQLVEQGKISLQANVGSYLPDYPNKRVAAEVTIHQLLTHTAGLGQFWTEEFLKASKDRYRTTADYLPLFVNDTLLFAPGVRHSYSNAGFIVLGLIIEKVSGQDYLEYVRQHIYQPAGMTNTDAYENDYVVPNLAVGYTEADARPGELKNNLFLHVVRGGPAGGGYSTVEDLLKFSNALLGYKLLSAKYTELAISGKVDDGAGARYGYGFRERVENGHHITGHTGGFPGISGYLGMFTDLGYTVAVLSNSDRGAVEVSQYIEEQIVGETQRARNARLTEMVLDKAVAQGYDAAVKLYEQNKRTGAVSEAAVNRRGYELLGEGKTSAAIDVFRLNVLLYPKSPNSFDSVGEAYMTAGNKELAIENYEKVLQLDPGSKSATEALRKLKGNY